MDKMAKQAIAERLKQFCDMKGSQNYGGQKKNIKQDEVLKDYITIFLPIFAWQNKNIKFNFGSILGIENGRKVPSTGRKVPFADRR